MCDNKIDSGENRPQWDVALAALVAEEYQRQGSTLGIQDFLRLAEAHRIRFDDIMDTLLRMTVLGRWVYHGPDGQLCPITQAQVDDMYKGGRLKNEDLAQYKGHWCPAKATIKRI